MYFKTLEIQGFKSFADKTILTFDSRMTAVVGANGNGKSNISDALRWVMGESGAKTLRSERMEDVIFHGTDGTDRYRPRKAAPFASVSLSIDNNDGALPIETGDVIITRRLSRSGDSDYLINGEKRRLSDIRDLLLGTGLGRDGYSIIGQGRCTELVSSRVKDRREIFEEAAGVSKFLHKKIEAERDLSRTEDNILRLLDKYEEYEKRLPILERQTEKAKKAVILKERERKLDLFSSVKNVAIIDVKLRETADVIWQNEGATENFDRIITNAENEREEISMEKMRLSEELTQIRTEENSADTERSEADKTAAIAENDISRNNSRIELLTEQAENSEKLAAESKKIIDGLSIEISKSENELNEFRTSLDEKTTQLNETDNLSTDEESKTLQNEINNLSSQKTAELTVVSASRRSVEEISASIDEERNSIASTQTAIEEQEAAKKSISESLKKITDEYTIAKNKADGANLGLENSRRKLRDFDEVLLKSRSEFETTNARIKAIEAIEQNMTGFGNSVKAVINAKRSGRISGIHGTIADCIRVEKEFSTAIETALGGTLQNIIVDNETIAERVLSFLKETRAGRATCFPLTTIKPNDYNFPSGLEQEDGFIGLAVDFIECDNLYDNIVHNLLGRTIIVDEVHSATRIGRRYGHKFRIVSLDGQIQNAGGSYTGGSVNEGGMVLARKSELDSLKVKIAKISDSLELQKSNRNTLYEEVSKAEAELDYFRDEASKLGVETAKLGAEAKGKENLISQLQVSLKHNEEKLSKRESNLISIKADVLAGEEKIEKIELEITELSEKATSVSEKLSEILNKRKLISDELSDLNLRILSVEKNIEIKETEMRNILSRVENIDSDKENYLNEIEELTNQNRELEKKREESLKKMKMLSVSGAKYKARTEGIILKQNHLEMRTGEINRDIKEKTAEREKFAVRLAESKERERNFKAEVEKIKSDLWRKYEITYAEAKLQIDVFPEELQKEYQLEELPDLMKINELLSDVRKELASLGNVNFAAVQEFEEVKTQYDIMTLQLTDAKGAKDKLQILIDELTETIKERFTENFNAISKYFEKIFVEIFSGGHARLELANPDDVLNSGIEIYAAPPGKVIKNLISLSGGEQTMVAVSIYLAILNHRPTPFCMLDEVDAALDEKNVSTYAAYLKKFSSKTQLMIITHRNGTMNNCDLLYGVYMQEKGVSKLMRLELTDFEEETLVEEQTSTNA